MGVAIVGASADSEKANQKFKDKHGLPYPLLCDDEARSLCKAFGVWQEKNMLGRKYMGVVRASFLIDQAGNVEKVFAKVKATRHPGEVVDLLRHPPST